MDSSSKVIIETTVTPVEIITIGTQGPPGGGGAVSSVNGQTGDVVIDAQEIGTTELVNFVNDFNDVYVEQL